MSLRRALIEALASEPCHSILVGIGTAPAGRKILNAVSQPYGVYATWEEGWKAARKRCPVGHEDPLEIDMQLRVSQTLRPSDYAVLYWLARMRSSAIKIFDFGGSVGNLYYSYFEYLRPLGVEWTVFDIPSVVVSGRKLAVERNAVGLKFANSVADLAPDQVLLISGAFHYWEGDIPAFFRQFPSRPQHIFINRSPIHWERPSFVTVQTTASCAFPCIVRNAHEVIEAFRVEGYELVDNWRAPELHVLLPLYPHLSVPHYSGFYFRKRGS